MLQLSSSCPRAQGQRRKGCMAQGLRDARACQPCSQSGPGAPCSKALWVSVTPVELLWRGCMCAAHASKSCSHGPRLR